MRKWLTVLAFAGATVACVGLITASAKVERVSAAPTRLAAASFEIDANEGYGVAQCLAEGRECGRVVADAFCETKGYARAAEFRRLDAPEHTASVRPAAAAASGDPATVVITCR